MNQSEVAEYLGVSPKTIRNWRYKGIFVEPFKLGSLEFWHQDDLDGWVQSQNQHLINQNSQPSASA